MQILCVSTKISCFLCGRNKFFFSTDKFVGAIYGQRTRGTQKLPLSAKTEGFFGLLFLFSFRIASLLLFLVK